MATTKPTSKQMNKTLNEWFGDEANSPHRLISATKFKELAKALDPDIRLDKETHMALCREVGRVVKKAMVRVYDNKRSTIRPLDL